LANERDNIEDCFYIACREGHVVLCQMLVNQYGANCGKFSERFYDYGYRTPLSLARQYQHHALVNYLVNLLPRYILFVGAGNMVVQREERARQCRIGIPLDAAEEDIPQRVGGEHGELQLGHVGIDDLLDV